MRALPLAAISLATLVLDGGPAGGQSLPEPEPFSLATLGLKGQAIVKQFGYARETSNDDRLHLAEGIVQLEWGRRLAGLGSLKLVVEARKDTDRLVEGVAFQVPDTRERRSILDLKEGAVGVRWEGAEITLGKQVFAWGTADAFNPTDNLNPYDYLDVIDNEKLGVYSAALRLTAGPGSLTAVIVPLFTPSRTPLPDSRWTPVPADGFAVTPADRELPARTLGSMQYATRARATIRGWDVSASYYEGFESTPVFRLSGDAPSGTAPPRLAPVFTRLRAVGFDFSTTYQRLELHGEGAFKLVERNGRDDRFQGVVGFNYTFAEPGIPWVEQVVLTAEYARQFVLASRPESGILPSDGAGSLFLLANDAFRNALAGRLAVKLDEDTRLELSGTADFSGPVSYYVQLKLARRLTDAVHAELGADVIEGHRDSFWGRWRSNDRLFLMVRYFF